MKMKPESKSLTLSRRKEELHRQSRQYRSALSSDLNDIKIDLSKWGKDFLIIGGSLYAVYKIYKLLRGSEEPQGDAKEPAQTLVVTKESSVIVAKFKEQITLFLLAMALKKLKEYINKQADE